jgi:hypothetical protein
MYDSAGKLEQKDTVALDLAMWSSHTKAPGFGSDGQTLLFEVQLHNGATSLARHNLVATTWTGS